MQLSTFCKNTSLTDIIKNKSVVCFVGKSYPLLFFSYLLGYLQFSFEMQIQKINLEQIEDSEVIQQLETSFLGQRVWYWFGNISALDEKRKKKWLTFINHYSGPHSIWCYVDDKTQPLLVKDLTIVDLPQVITYSLYESFFCMFNADVSPDKPILLKSLFNKKINISLDYACLLMSYNVVVGRNVHQFIDQWSERLIAPDISLFSLSTYFFAKDQKKFFSLWSNINQDYSPQFWLAFWSEQLFRACGFIHYMQKNNRLEAKKIAYRLPFSFIQRDWRKHSYDELKRLHNALYSCDFDIKNGSKQSLDFFYYKYFLK